MAAQSASTQDLKDPWLRSWFTNRLGALDRERVLVRRDVARPRRQLRAAPRPLPRRRQRQPQGQPRDHRIVDNTPLLAARVMASGMMAGISSPARPWFRLRLPSDPANQEAPSASGSTRCSAACCTSSRAPTSTTACTRSTASSAPSAPQRSGSTRTKRMSCAATRSPPANTGWPPRGVLPSTRSIARCGGRCGRSSTRSAATP